MDQQFSLSWNNFHGNLSKGFAGLLGKGEFVDVTLAVEGHLLQAHKVILSICSPYFKKMFQMNPCQHPIVVLRDVTLKAMKDLLQFMYQGEVSVKREDLTNFIGTAEVLQIKGLTHKEAEEEESERLNELSKQNLARQNDSPDIESSISDNFDSSPNEVLESSELELLQQRQFIEKLQRLSQLKRKSEEFLQKAYYPDILNSEKRPKLDDKIVCSNYDNFKNVYEETPINITTTLNTSIHKITRGKEDSDKRKEFPVSANPVEVKTESDDVDIVVTENVLCTTPKAHECSRESKNTSSVTLDYQSPQDSALSLVVNGSSVNQPLPVRYKYIYSRKGHKQLVHMNFVYTKHSTTHGKTSWRCVQYFSLNRCPATVETIDAMIYAVNHEHNHEDCYEKLSRNNIYEMNNSPQ